MDALHAWDQPHLYIHVPGRADRPDRAVIIFQTSLDGGGRFAGRGRLSLRWGARRSRLPQELQDASGGVGGSMAAFAEEIF